MNLVEDEGATSLADALRVNKSLKVLELVMQSIITYEELGSCVIFSDYCDQYPEHFPLSLEGVPLEDCRCTQVCSLRLKWFDLFHLFHLVLYQNGNFVQKNSPNINTKKKWLETEPF